MKKKKTTAIGPTRICEAAWDSGHRDASPVPFLGGLLVDRRAADGGGMAAAIVAPTVRSAVAGLPVTGEAASVAVALLSRRERA